LEGKVITPEEFLRLPNTEVARLVAASGPQVCVFPINGTRRWFMLEQAAKPQPDYSVENYMEAAGRAHINVYRLCFEHGLTTLLTPVFGAELLTRGEGYLQKIGADGMRRLAIHPDFTNFYDEYQVSVRFYGDYRKSLAGTPYADLCELFDQITAKTSGYKRYRLFFGVFASDASEWVADFSVEFYKKFGRVPTRPEIIVSYYGIELSPATLFIGFDKFSVFDYPLLSNGEEDLYFTVAPSLYLDPETLRNILYDHIYTRRLPEPDYASLQQNDFEKLKKFYRSHLHSVQGVGRRESEIWLPDISSSRNSFMILAHELLQNIKHGKMSSTVYDTSWLARLGELDSDLSNTALEWIGEHQLSDGSWGARAPLYYHDRIISTLAAMVALNYRGRRAQDRMQIEHGLQALEKIAHAATGWLQSDLNGATVGFEMIAPVLVAEAEKLGIIKQQGERVLGRLSRMREAKLAKIRGQMINRKVTMAFSAEMAGLDGQHMLDIANLQEENGSVGDSPSATAYFALYVKPGDQAALNYLRQSVNPDGGAPDLAPFEVYERAWVLWNLSLYDGWDSETRAMFKPHLDYLSRHWNSKSGIGFSAAYSVPDGDDTIITYELLQRNGYDVDIRTVLDFEEETYFRCYQLEVGISPSVNIHALMALRQAGYDTRHPTVQKTLNFLSGAQTSHDFWIDKWHSSPFYTTAHFVIACKDLLDSRAEQSVNWILKNQRMDGSWGFFLPTVEETAYCLQALSVWQKKTNRVPKEALSKGLSWMVSNFNQEYPPLWIGKGLYTADNVVRSAVLSALALTQSVL
jgi:halimadienyl-diphosphate synthase